MRIETTHRALGILLSALHMMDREMAGLTEPET